MTYDERVQSMEWVKTSDKMPPELVMVLCLIPDQGDHICTAIWERREGWYESYNNEIIMQPVTHWMLLPEPPKITKP